MLVIVLIVCAIVLAETLPAVTSQRPSKIVNASIHANLDNAFLNGNGGKLFVESQINVPWADSYLTREQLNSDDTLSHFKWVGEMRHDQHRQRGLYEDFSLPVPVNIHALGHHRHRQLRREQDATSLPESETSQNRAHVRRLSRRRMATVDSAATLPVLLTPLYQGYGTHFSYVYIGTPPQRQSVIVDTGSHFTAFPCVGCQQCGSHTDNYWDPKNSTTANVQKCNGGDLCTFGQSYSEGSSWRAYKVVDKLWVGGIGKETVPTGSKYTVDFMFGCQTSETGLFRTQLADGIMGMAMAVETLPSQLVEQKVAASNIFAMCFRVGGGIMTLGGVDQRIHSKPGILYAGIKQTDGWYTVTLLDIQLMDQGANRAKKTIGADPAKYSAGKGAIVDSGTTDTYLPMAVAAEFGRLFKEITGVVFSSKNTKLTAMDLAKMPDIVFVLQGVDGKAFDVVMPWNNYVDKVGTDLYAFRVYLTEGSGAVLGANFMDGYNVIFDKSNKRVGFAKSDCVYENFMIKETDAPTPAPTTPSGAAPTADVACQSKQKAVGECSARCNTYQEESHMYKKAGTQEYVETCAPGSGVTSETPPEKHITKNCDLSCNGNKIVRGIETCPEKPWNPCLKSCIQSRDMPDVSALTSNVCSYQQQTRSCYSGDCPMQDGDMLIFIDMRVGVQPSQWSYVYSETFFLAMSSMFNVNAQNMELLNDPRSEFSLSAKLHFQIRLKAKDYSSKKELTAAAQAIPVLCWKENFGAVLLAALETSSQAVDKINYSRYGYLDPATDVEVLNAVALPIGDVRDPIDIPLDNESPVIVENIKQAFKGNEVYFFIGVGIAVSGIVCCMMFLYVRLHRESLELAKEKVQNTTLMRMLQRMKSWRSGERVEFDENSGHMYSEVEMAESNRGTGRGAINPLHDDQLDEEEMTGSI